MSRQGGRGRRRQSTNPFDDSSDEECFFDCLPEPDVQSPPTVSRAAPLDFNNPSYSKIDSEPALQFDRVESSTPFFSPLENALLEQQQVISPLNEETPLINPYQHQSGNSSSSTRRQKSRNSKASKSKQRHSRNWILSQLDTAEQRNAEAGMEYYKMILLEDLGTAASWTILLLPYIAFAFCLFLESSTLWKVEHAGPFNASMPCASHNATVPLLLTSTYPCYFPFRNTHPPRLHPIRIDNHSSIVTTGVAWDSAEIEDVPLLSTYFYGDAVFAGLSSEAVEMVAKGLISYSVAVLQKSVQSDNLEGRLHEWTTVYVSDSERLTMACHNADKDGRNDSPSSWNCTRPRIVDVLFALPGATVHSGKELRVNVLYSYTTEYGFGFYYDHHSSFVYSQELTGLNNIRPDATTMFSGGNLEEIVKSSSYTFEYSSSMSELVNTGMRAFSLTTTFLFTIYWCRSIGMKGFFSFNQMCCCRGDDVEARETVLWWESPWILFPERYYILLLLVFLMLLQGPFLVIMYFFPDLERNAQLHVAADAMIGVANNGILFVYLCLFHGFRFHRAAVSRKRTEAQRQVMQLRRAAEYVKEAQNGAVGDVEQSISHFARDYYEKYGDLDGSGSIIRLEHDPFARATWADFFIPKLLLFTVGIASVLLTAYCRLPSLHDEEGDPYVEKYDAIYVASSFVTFATLVAWMLLIFRTALETGEALHKEPFLSTRPAQLAYRILFAHMSLGFTALVVSFFVGVFQLFVKWAAGEESTSTSNLLPALNGTVSRSAALNLSLRILRRVTARFPYSGTAASVGPGRILFATVSILITAFIFLPPRIFDEGEHDEWENLYLIERRRQHRDKRLVVLLARHTHTWRVFPLPIKKSAAVRNMLSEGSFQLYQSLQVDFTNSLDKGVVFMGPYIPVFCLELACWLNEASWQAYYTPAKMLSDSASGNMNLQSLGLRLECSILDESTDTHVFIASNTAPQVDGDVDSIIVVAFRGTANASNIRSDLKARQVPLLDQMMSSGQASFLVSSDRIDVFDADGWIWNTPCEETAKVMTFSPKKKASFADLSFHRSRQKQSALSAVSRLGRAVLRATPVARNALPSVHEGFQEVYTHIRRKVIEAILPVLQRQLAKATCHGKDGEPLSLPKIYITGHSLGGSLGQLLALDLATSCELVLDARVDEKQSRRFSTRNESGSMSSGGADVRLENSRPARLRLQPPIAVYTFGQPRLGNKPFSRLYKERVPHTFRVVTEGDPITAMPNRVFCGGVYKHAGLEVVLDEGQTGNILVGPTVVETLFRFHKVRTNLAAHSMSRYRDCLESGFEPHDLREYYEGHSNNPDQAGPVTAHHPDIPEWLVSGKT